MFVDSVTIVVKAGNGGGGAATLRRTAQTSKGGPDGGDGGNGGNVYFRGSSNVNDLSIFRYKKKVVALDGTPGRSMNLFGKNAPHKITEIPIGTTITDLDSGQVWEAKDTTTLMLLAHGGLGGRGNVHFKSAINQTPRSAEPGEIGEKRRLLLDLKIIAAIGITGLPNSGKSSLLSVLTRATPKIGNYPFTTLEPNIGMMDDFALADVPGIIEGASTGKGLGLRFLKHIEKTKLLVHCIDAAGDDPQAAYDVIRREFGEFNRQLLEKPEVILLTKIDLVPVTTKQKYRTYFQKKGLRVMTYSLYDPKSITSLKNVLKALIS